MNAQNGPNKDRADVERVDGEEVIRISKTVCRLRLDETMLAANSWKQVRKRTQLYLQFKAPARRVYCRFNIENLAIISGTLMLGIVDGR